MKIRLTVAPPLPAAYGLVVGSVHVARTNWLAGKEPKWFIDVKHGNAAFPVGIRSDEAEEVQE